MNDDFARLPAGVPAALVEANVGHSGTFRQRRGGSYARIARAWLDWHLKGDRAASVMFQGPDCTLCRDPDFRISRKNLR